MAALSSIKAALSSIKAALDTKPALTSIKAGAPRATVIFCRFAVAVAFVGACNPEPDAPTPPQAPGAVLEHVRAIPLEGGDAPPLLDLADLAVDADGYWFVLDGQTARLHKYDPSGTYVASVSGPDGAAVDLRQPSGTSPRGVTVGRDDHLYVAGAPAGSVAFDPARPTAAVARISPDLAVDAVFAVEGAYFLTEVHAWDDRIATVLMRPEGPGNEVLVVGYDGTPESSFHPRDPRMEDVPYWSGWFTTHAAAAGDELAVVNSLYPVHRYGREGELAGTFGGPSPSFREPSRPELWAFAGPEGRAEHDAWLKSFTTVSSIHVLSGSTVVVVLEDKNPEETAVAESSWRADVFALESGQAIARDLPLAGRVVEADSLLYVAARDPEHGWHIELLKLEMDP